MIGNEEIYIENKDFAFIILVRACVFAEGDFSSDEEKTPRKRRKTARIKKKIPSPASEESPKKLRKDYNCIDDGSERQYIRRLK